MINIKLFFEQIPGLIYWKDIKGAYHGCNAEYMHYTNLLTTEDIYGKTSLELLKNHPLEDAKKTHKDDLIIISCAISKHSIKTCKDLNGKESLLRVSKKPIFNKKKEVIGLLVISIDVSNPELDQVLEIMDATPGNIYWTDNKGIYQGCNLNNAKTLNLKKTSDIIGKSALDFAYLISEEVAQRVYNDDIQILQEGKEKVFEEIGTNKQNEIRTYLTKKTPLFNDKKEITGLVGISIDISDQKRIENLQRDLEIQKNITQTYKTLTHTIAHEARTPLSAAIIAAKTLKKSLLSSNVKNSHDKKWIEGQINKIVRLCSNTNKFINMHVDIHYLDKLSKENFEIISVNELLNESIHSFPYNSGERELVAFKNLPYDFYIDGDFNLLTHVVWNIIKNAIYAIKHNEKGHLNICPYLENNILKIKFEDNAGGIAKEIINNIFDPFYTKKTSGTGIGLYFCKEVMLKHNGEILCSSKNDQTIFYLSFKPSKNP